MRTDLLVSEKGAEIMEDLMPEPRVCVVCLHNPCNCPEMSEEVFDEESFLDGIRHSIDLAEIRFRRLEVIA